MNTEETSAQNNITRFTQEMFEEAFLQQNGSTNPLMPQGLSSNTTQTLWPSPPTLLPYQPPDSAPNLTIDGFTNQVIGWDSSSVAPLSELDANANSDAALIMFILWGIVLPMVAGVGLIGNLLTMMVLWRREMHSTTILYLRALVVTDTGILIGSVITLTPLSCANYLQGPSLIYFKEWVYPRIHTPGYYVIMSLQQCNVWITVSVSVERYIAICHPFRAARIITKQKTIIVIVLISVFSLLYNIPHLFATEVIDCTAFNASMISTEDPPTRVTNPPQNNVSPHSCLTIHNTDFGASLFYRRFRTILYAAIIHIIPLLALVILNSFLIRELMIMRRRRTMSSGAGSEDDNEANLSLVLVLIVIVFILCQTPGLVSQFEIQPKEAFHVWIAVANLLFATNSAVNFLIYTAFGRKFRRVLLNVFQRISTRGSKLQSHFSQRAFHYNDYEMTTVGDSGNSRRPSEGNNCNGNNCDSKLVPKWNHITQKQSLCENLLNGSQKVNGV